MVAFNLHLISNLDVLAEWMSFVGLGVISQLSHSVMEHFYELKRDPAFIAYQGGIIQIDKFPFDPKDQAFGLWEKSCFGRL